MLLLTTNTDKINWGEDFTDNFVLNMNEIYFGDLDISISFIMPGVEDYDEEEEMFFINELEINTGGRKSIKYISPTKLFINEKILSNIELRSQNEETDKTIITVDSKNFQDEMLFKFQTQNNEMIKSLQQILDLIESADHLGITDYNEFVNKFDDLLIENKLSKIMSVHIEMIASSLIKDSKTNEKPDFSGDEIPEYHINRVSRSIMESPLSVSLSFERLNDQFADLDTYEKESKSIMDNLFH